MDSNGDSCRSHRPLLVTLVRSAFDQCEQAGCRRVIAVDLQTRDLPPGLRSSDEAILVIVDNVEGETIVASLLIGVNGVITASDNLATLVEAIYVLRTGGSYISDSAADVVLTAIANARPTTVQHPREFSAREQDVIREMIAGSTAKAMARSLGIASKTVEAHKTRIFVKLGVRTQAEAVAYLLETSLRSSMTT